MSWQDVFIVWKQCVGFFSYHIFNIGKTQVARKQRPAPFRFIFSRLWHAPVQTAWAYKIDMIGHVYSLVE